jgi:hypothetical protein
MSGKFGRFLGMVMVITLMMMAGGFLIFLFDDMSNQGFEYVLLGLAGLGGLGWLLLRGPVGKALASMLEGGSVSEDQMLALRVADLEDRLQEVSLETQRFLEIEERLEFTERLLAQHTDPARRLGES